MFHSIPIYTKMSDEYPVIRSITRSGSIVIRLRTKFYLQLSGGKQGPEVKVGVQFRKGDLNQGVYFEEPFIVLENGASASSKETAILTACWCVSEFRWSIFPKLLANRSELCFERSENAILMTMVIRALPGDCVIYKASVPLEPNAFVAIRK